MPPGGVVKLHVVHLEVCWLKLFRECKAIHFFRSAAATSIKVRRFMMYNLMHNCYPSLENSKRATAKQICAVQCGLKSDTPSAAVYTTSDLGAASCSQQGVLRRPNVKMVAENGCCMVVCLSVCLSV